MRACGCPEPPTTEPGTPKEDRQTRNFKLPVGEDARAQCWGSYVSLERRWSALSTGSPERHLGEYSIRCQANPARIEAGRALTPAVNGNRPTRTLLTGVDVRRPHRSTPRPTARAPATLPGGQLTEVTRLSHHQEAGASAARYGRGSEHAPGYRPGDCRTGGVRLLLFRSRPVRREAGPTGSGTVRAPTSRAGPRP